MHRTRRSFKERLNEEIRRGSATGRRGRRRARFVVKARPMGLQASIDPAGLNKLADDLEIEAAKPRLRPNSRE